VSETSLALQCNMAALATPFTSARVSGPKSKECILVGSTFLGPPEPNAENIRTITARLRAERALEERITQGGQDRQADAVPSNLPVTPIPPLPNPKELHVPTNDTHPERPPRTQRAVSPLPVTERNLLLECHSNVFVQHTGNRYNTMNTSPW
jgi:hypothetical protein